jgi:Collagen triple helix repeat (20 copies)
VLKKMKKVTQFVLSFLIVAFLINCKGPEGPVGPQGVKGDTGLQGEKGNTGAAGPAGTNGTNGTVGATGLQGPQGATGAAGAKGDKGDTGAVNIIFSDWFSKEWTSVSNSQTQYRFVVNEAKITADILNKGVVLVYMRTQSSSPTVYQLPLTLATETGIQVYSVTTEVGKIILNLIELLDIRTTPANYQFRYVVIPAGATSGRVGIDYSNYEAVKQAFNLPN